MFSINRDLLIIAMTEEQLIANLRKGRQSALSEIYDLYAQELLVFCFSYTKSKQDAEEVVQDSFLRLWEMRSSIRSDHSLKSLLFKIAKNRVIDLFKSNLNSKIFADYLLFQQSDAVNESADMDYDGYRLLVDKVLMKLPPSQREIVRLSDFDGLNNSQIAQKLNITEKTVRNQLSAGNQLFYKLLKNALKFLCFIFSLSLG